MELSLSITTLRVTQKVKCHKIDFLNLYVHRWVKKYNTIVWVGSCGIKIIINFYAKLKLLLNLNLYFCKNYHVCCPFIL